MSDLLSNMPETSTTELGVKLSATLTPLSSKKPWRCAAQIGRLWPPSNAMTRSGLGGAAAGAGWAAAGPTIAASARPASAAMRRNAMVVMGSPAMWAVMTVRRSRGRSPTRA